MRLTPKNLLDISKATGRKQGATGKSETDFNQDSSIRK